MKKILNLFPERAWWNFAIAGVSLVAAIGCLAPYGLGTGARVAGVILAVICVLAAIRYFSQNLKGKE